MKWFSYYDQCYCDIETSQFIIIANQLTGFCMKRALTLNWLSFIELEVLIYHFVR